MSVSARGVGLGFRAELSRELFLRPKADDPIAWVEIHPENYIGRGGRRTKAEVLAVKGPAGLA